MPSDLRSVEARARDAWFESEAGRECCEGKTSGQYLRNRLERAFLAGLEAGKQIRSDAIRDRFEELIDDLLVGSDDVE